MSVALEVPNPEKVLFPGDGLTKSDLADYYRRVAEVMLPHVAGRPLHLQRFPDGIEGEEIHQKQVPDHFPDLVRRVRVPRRRGGTVTHAVADDAETLVYLAGQAVVTPHVWLARADDLEHPDRLVFDLDPADGDFAAVREAALALRAVLNEVGLVPFVQATGSRGLHVVVPLDREADFDETRAFARAAAERVAEQAPDRFTTAQRKEKRRGRLYLDTARNGYAQTAVAPYAVRGRPHAPVAAPLDWAELGRPALTADRYTIRNLFRGLARKADPWGELDAHAGSLPTAAERLRARRG